MTPAITLAIKKLYHQLLAALPSEKAVEFDHFIHHFKLPQLDDPVTFSEWVQHRKLYDRDPRLPELSDKILAKEYVAKALGPDWVIPTIWFGESLPPVSQRDWPVPYVLKASHGSGWNIFIRTQNDAKWGEIERTTRQWLARKYGTHVREWAYSQIEPRLLVEPCLDSVGLTPNDYKLWVFGGKVHFIQVDIDRFGNHRQNFFDRDWKRQPFEYAAPGTAEDVPPPLSLEKMISGAEILAANLPFVRVDLYEIGGSPLFGEFTFYPTSAQSRFTARFDAVLGQLWRPPAEVLRP